MDELKKLENFAPEYFKEAKKVNNDKKEAIRTIRMASCGYSLRQYYCIIKSQFCQYKDTY